MTLFKLLDRLSWKNNYANILMFMEIVLKTEIRLWIQYPSTFTVKSKGYIFHLLKLIWINPGKNKIILFLKVLWLEDVPDSYKLGN